MAASLLAPYAGVLALFYVWLSFRITGFRRRHRQAFGVTEDDAFQRAVRAQANFAEYVPFALLILYLLASLSLTPWAIHVLAAMLVLGRAAHAYSLLAYEPNTGRYRFRIAGMILTFSMFGLGGLLLCAYGFGVLA